MPSRGRPAAKFSYLQKGSVILIFQFIVIASSALALVDVGSGATTGSTHLGKNQSLPGRIACASNGEQGSGKYGPAAFSVFEGRITTIDIWDSELYDTLNSLPVRRSNPRLSNPLKLTIVLVGGRGYASLSNYQVSRGTVRGKVLCATWVENIPDSNTLVFGKGRSRNDVTVWGGNWGRTCSEFSVNQYDDNRVRITAARYDYQGPVAGRKYVGEHQIMHQTAIEPVDWSQPVVNFFEIKGRVIGPRDVHILPSNLRDAAFRKIQSSKKSLGVSSLAHIDTHPAVENSKVSTVSRSYLMGPPGLVKGPMVIYELGYVENYRKIKPRAGSVRSALIQRYGSPSAEIEGNILVWAHDLSGTLITENVEACLPSSDLGANDVGPWSCGLVLWVQVNSSGNRVNSYRMKVYHGSGLAHHVFADALLKMAEVREQIEAEQTVTPKF